MVRKAIVGGLVAVVTTGVLLAFYGFKAYSHHSHELMLDWKINMISKELTLNEEQRAKLEDVKQTMLEKWKESKENRNTFADQLAELVGQEEVDQEAVNDLIVEYRADMGEMIPSVIESYSEFHDTLKKEQKEKIANMIKNHKSWGCHSNEN